MAKNRVVAIDIGTNTAKIVQLEQSSTTVHLTNANVVTYPDKDDRLQVYESVKHLWDSLGDLPVEGGIRALFNRNKTEIALALPRSLVNTKRLSNLPAATDDQLASIVAIAAEAELPFELKRLSLRITMYNRHRYLFRRINIHTANNSFKLFGSPWTDWRFRIGSYAFNDSYSGGGARSGCTKPTFIVDIGAEQADFCFMQGGKLKFSRSFRFGGNHLSEHLSRTLNIDVEMAAEEKQRISAGETPAITWTTQFISELRRSIAATTHFEAEVNTGRYRDLTLPETETELWLCGGGARVPDLVSVCETELNISTQLWNPLHALQQGAGIDIRPMRPGVEAILDEWGDTLAVPLGVGLNALNSADRVSLLPQEAVETLTQTARQRQLFAAAGLSVLIIGGMLFGGYMLQRSQQYRNEAVEAQLTYYAQPMSAAKAQLGKELALTDMLAHHISPLDILHALSEMFGDRTQVAWTNFNITNLHEPATARITFNLESASHNAINTLLGALDRSGVFTNVRPGEVTTISQNRKQIFQVQVRCNLTTSAVESICQETVSLA